MSDDFLTSNFKVSETLAAPDNCEHAETLEVTLAQTDASLLTVCSEEKQETLYINAPVINTREQKLSNYQAYLLID